MCCVKNADSSFFMRSSTFWNPAVNSLVWRSWHGWRDTATFSQAEGRNTCGGGTGRHTHAPSPLHFWFKVCLSGLVNYFLQLPACISKTTPEGSHPMLWDRPRPQSCKRWHLIFSVWQSTSPGFRTVNVCNKGHDCPCLLGYDPCRFHLTPRETLVEEKSSSHLAGTFCQSTEVGRYT